MVVIDEAQRITNIGLGIKLMTDNLTDVQVIATGSSSFDLSNKINDPLTGRKLEYWMFPLSFGELVEHQGLLEEKRLLPHRLVYPDVINNAGDERMVLTELAESYLYKDILMFDKIKKSDKLVKLLQALAFQIGSEVSYNELAQTCGLDPKTRQEIDYIEDMDGQLSAVEMKWNPKQKATMPLSFAKSYTDVDFKVVTRENYESFLL